jgi:DNA-binding SARP family transcriptional activator
MLGMTRRPEAEEQSLLGRDHLLDRLDTACLAAGDGRSERVAVVGEPGSGRTAVVDHLAGRAKATMTVLRGDPVSGEAALAYAGLFDLCRPVLHLLDELAPTSAGVLRAALGLGPAVPMGTMAVGASLLALLSRAARDQPVVVIVDDLDAADDETFEALLFAVRRLRDDRVAAVVTAAPDAAERLGGAGFDVVGLEPLGRDDATLLLERSCPVAPDPAVRDALLDVAQGVPLALTLLPRALSLPQLKGRWPLPDPLPSPDRLGDVVAGDLAGLEPGHRRALLTVATSLTGSRSSITAALVALDLPPAALDDLVRSGHLLADGDRLRFTRPLLRSIAYATADSADRRLSHLALAEAIGGEVSLEQRAWHRSSAVVGPDAEAADLLEQSAAGLRARGASAAAAAALDRSVALTVDRRLRARRRVAAASDLLGIGETERARIHLDGAEAECDDVEVVAAALHLRGRVLVNDGAGVAAQAAFREGALLVRRHDPRRATLMLCEAALAAVHGRRYTEAQSLAANATATAATAGADGRAAALAGLVRGAALVAGGDTRAGRSALRVHLAALDVAEAIGDAAPIFDGVALALVWAERYREARRLLDAVIDERRRTMALGLLPTSLGLRALLGHRTGYTVRAFADAVEALRLMDGDDGHAQRASALAVLSSVESTLGLRAACLTHVEQCLEALGERGRRSTLRVGAISAAASVELSCGHHEAAVSWLDVLAGERRAGGQGNPATVMWEGDYVEALIAAGRLDDAATVLEDFEARAAAAGNRRALGAAARGRGLLAGDLDEAVTAFAASVEHYSRHDHLVGRGRTRLVWAERLAADGRPDAAVDAFRSALADLDEAGAAGWSGRAARGLAALGVTVERSRPVLAELPSDVAQVALLAATGFDITKIADHLLISRATVNQLLRRATELLGERPTPALLRPLPDAAAPAEAAADRDDEANDEPEPASTAVRVLGRFAVDVGGTDRTPPAGLGARLVKLLAVSPAAGLAIDEAVELLWPDLEPAKGRARLRNVLSRLRTTSGDIVVRSGDGLRLADGVDVDLRRFGDLATEALAAAASGGSGAPAAARAAIDDHAGDLLPDSPYESWAAAPRERVRRRRLELLALLADDHCANGRTDDAIRLLEQAIDLDPYDEERYVVAAELRREQGRHGAAMALLARARAVVGELGLAPSPRLVDVETSLRP